MKIVVAGSTGFLGRALVRRLRAQGHRVVELARRHPDPACRWDVSATPPPVERLAGADALVNLVGRKRGSRRAFEAAHVHAARNLVAAAHAAGVHRFVHVSVACAPSLPPGPYADTKRAGEAVVRASGLAYVLVRPNVVFGPGDDLVRNAARTLALAAVAPVPRGGGPLAPVARDDVVAVLAEAAAGAIAPGTTVAVHGPRTFDAAALFRTVGRALDLPAHPVPVAPALLAAAAAVASLLPDPLVTRAQVRLLAHGLAPAEDPGRRGPTPLDRAQVERALAGARSFAQADPATGRAARALAGGAATRLGSVAALLAGLAGAFFALGRLGLPVWAVVGLATPLAAAVIWRGWPALTAALVARPQAPGAAARDAAVVALATIAAAAWVFSPLAPPTLARAFAPVRALVTAAPAAPALLALPLLVLAEDLVFRGLAAYTLAGRLGPGLGAAAAALAFAALHAAFGAPPALLAAALGCGAVWNLLALRHASLWPVFAAHLALDVAVVALAAAGPAP